MTTHRVVRYTAGGTTFHPNLRSSFRFSGIDQSPFLLRQGLIGSDPGSFIVYRFKVRIPKICDAYS
jgi:hypothetical protein